MNGIGLVLIIRSTWTFAISLYRIAPTISILVMLWLCFVRKPALTSAMCNIPIGSDLYSIGLIGLIYVLDGDH